jgi:hypothetical protein
MDYEGGQMAMKVQSCAKGRRGGFAHRIRNGVVPLRGYLPLFLLRSDMSGTHPLATTNGAWEILGVTAAQLVTKKSWRL